MAFAAASPPETTDPLAQVEFEIRRHMDPEYQHRLQRYDKAIRARQGVRKFQKSALKAHKLREKCNGEAYIASSPSPCRSYCS